MDKKSRNRHQEPDNVGILSRLGAKDILYALPDIFFIIDKSGKVLDYKANEKDLF